MNRRDLFKGAGATAAAIVAQAILPTPANATVRTETWRWTTQYSDGSRMTQWYNVYDRKELERCCIEQGAHEHSCRVSKVHDRFERA